MEKVLVDIGHGGKDQGATGNGLRESDCNLSIGLVCETHLLNNYVCDVELTRRTDEYVYLPTRAAMGRGKDLMVSIHNNSFGVATARGYETFCHDGPLFESTLEMREVIHRQVYSYLQPLGVPDRGMRRHNHYITRVPQCPVVLVEYLFISNSTDAAILKNPDHLRNLGIQTARGIAKALKLPKKETDEQIWYRAIAGSWLNRENAEAAVKHLQTVGFDAFLEVSKQ